MATLLFYLIWMVKSPYSDNLNDPNYVGGTLTKKNDLRRREKEYYDDKKNSIWIFIVVDIFTILYFVW